MAEKTQKQILDENPEMETVPKRPNAAAFSKGACRRRPDKHKPKKPSSVATAETPFQEQRGKEKKAKGG